MKINTHNHKLFKHLRFDSFFEVLYQNYCALRRNDVI